MKKHDGYMKSTIDVEYADIPHMRDMSDEGYYNYVAEELFWVDHHGILREVQSQHPIATTRAQLAELIRYLREEVEPRMEQ